MRLMLRHGSRFRRLWLGIVLPLRLSARWIVQFSPNFHDTISTKHIEVGQFTLIDGADDLRTNSSLIGESSFPVALFPKGVTDVGQLSASDKLELIGIQNMSQPMYASDGNRVFASHAIRMLQAGQIFVPYVGSVDTAGLKINGVRAEIVNILGKQTPNRQATSEWVSFMRKLQSACARLLNLEIPTC